MSDAFLRLALLRSLARDGDRLKLRGIDGDGRSISAVTRFKPGVPAFAAKLISKSAKDALLKEAAIEGASGASNFEFHNIVGCGLRAELWGSFRQVGWDLDGNPVEQFEGVCEHIVGARPWRRQHLDWPSVTLTWKRGKASLPAPSKETLDAVRSIHERTAGQPWTIDLDGPAGLHVVATDPDGRSPLHAVVPPPVVRPWIASI